MFLTIKLILNRTDYLRKMDLGLNNLQRLIGHKTQPTNQPNQTISGGIGMKVAVGAWLEFELA